MSIIKYFIDVFFICIMAWILYGACAGLRYFFGPDKFVFEFFVFVAIASLYLRKKDD